MVVVISSQKFLRTENIIMVLYTISFTPYPPSIITGHMDGFLHLIGHNGLPQHSIQAHSKPVSVLVCHGDVVITGSYDTEVKVHRVRDFYRLQSVHIHTGSISAITLLEVRVGH